MTTDQNTLVHSYSFDNSFEEKSFEEALECFDILGTVEFNEELVERLTKSKKEDEDGVEVDCETDKALLLRCITFSSQLCDCF
jgi:hypothetical protein